MFVWLTMALSQFHVCLIDDGPFPVPCLSDWRWPFLVLLILEAALPATHSRVSLADVIYYVAAGGYWLISYQVLGEGNQYYNSGPR